MASFAPAPIRAGLVALALVIAAPLPSSAQDALRDALAAADRGDVSRFEAARGQLSRLDQKIADWALIRSGAANASFITTFAAANPSWPDAEMFRRRAEVALERQNPPAAEVVAAFGGSQPITARGAMLLARAQAATGRGADATALVRRAWREMSMDDGTEQAFFNEFSGQLTAADHKARLDRALLKENADDAMRMARVLGGGWPQLVTARMAVEKKRPNAQALMASVPASLQGEPAYIFGRAQAARRAERWQEAADWLMKAPRDPRAMVVPDEWWEEKRIVSRKLLELGNARLAYQLVRDHVGSTRAKQAEADFHKGWYSLRFLNNPSQAMAHFRAVGAGSQSPITVARGHYWMGRAAEAMGSGEARQHYQNAARHPNAFYGMLARTKLGVREIGMAAAPQPTAEDRSVAENDDRFQAIRRLWQTGRQDLARSLFMHMARTLKTPGQVAMLVQLADALGSPTLVVKVGKEAIQRDLDVEILAYPTRGLPQAELSGLESSLAWAIARQESEFDHSVVSTAGAVGVFQVMPATAAHAARLLGISLDRGRWRGDPSYNLMLGARYVKMLADNYDGNYVMAIAGYNAGPGRIKEWVERFGDPRDPKVDIVDWMEMIPFGETRNYVHRVLENLQIYRMRREGRQLELVADLRRGVGARGSTQSTATSGSTTTAEHPISTGSVSQPFPRD